MKLYLLYILFILSLSINLNASTIGKGLREIDMMKYHTIAFDSLVTNISCTKIAGAPFDLCVDMMRYQDYLYFMGSTIAGRKVVIYNTNGKLIRELNFADALMVNSMCIVPESQELWVVSRFKIINKFKLDGTLIRRNSLPFPCANVIPVRGDDYLIYAGGSANKRGSIEGYFMALTDFKSIKGLFMSMWGVREWPQTNYNLYTSDMKSNIYIFPGGTDTIYSYDYAKKEVHPIYRLNFHNELLMLDNKVYNDDRAMSDVITKRSYIYQHYSFYEAGNKLFFRLKGKREDFCCIDLQKHILYSFDRLFDYFRSAYINPFIGAYEDNLYLLVMEKDLFENYQNVKCSYPDIKKLLSTYSPKTNDWILLTIKIKK